MHSEMIFHLSGKFNRVVVSPTGYQVFRQGGPTSRESGGWDLLLVEAVEVLDAQLLGERAAQAAAAAAGKPAGAPANGEAWFVKSILAARVLHGVAHADANNLRYVQGFLENRADEDHAAAARRCGLLEALSRSPVVHGMRDACADRIINSVRWHGMLQEVEKLWGEVATEAEKEEASAAARRPSLPAVKEPGRRDAGMLRERSKSL